MMTREMSRVALALAGAAALGGCTNSMNNGMPMASAAGRMDMAGMEAMLASWPEASRMAAMDIMRKYGPPQGVTPTMLSWDRNGPWAWTRIFREPVQHNFPMPHPDVLEQAIHYNVPVDRFDDLAQFDGSVMAERTKGQLSARCDKEGANFLAINLANDVATRRRTVADARAFYTRAMATFKQTNRMDPYMQRLQFQPPGPNAGDPDRATM